MYACTLFILDYVLLYLSCSAGYNLINACNPMVYVDMAMHNRVISACRCPVTIVTAWLSSQGWLRKHTTVTLECTVHKYIFIYFEMTKNVKTACTDKTTKLSVHPGGGWALILSMYNSTMLCYIVMNSYWYTQASAWYLYSYYCLCVLTGSSPVGDNRLKHNGYVLPQSTCEWCMTGDKLTPLKYR
jgi:hypothetical protein